MRLLLSRKPGYCQSRQKTVPGSSRTCERSATPQLMTDFETSPIDLAIDANW
jgi:hypothetical protein